MLIACPVYVGSINETPIISITYSYLWGALSCTQYSYWVGRLFCLALQAGHKLRSRTAYTVNSRTGSSFTVQSVPLLTLQPISKCTVKPTINMSHFRTVSFPSQRSC